MTDTLPAAAGAVLPGFSNDDARLVTDAVRAAEARTAGEIVPYVVGRCDDYDEAAWMGATYGALAGGAIAVATAYLGLAWGLEVAIWLALLLAGTALGHVLGAHVGAVTRRLVPRAVLAARVDARAHQAFLVEEVFATQGRTGILLFVALFERRAQVVADAGIHAVVEDNAWQVIVDELAAGIGRGAAGRAMAGAIERCADLLAETVPHAADDANESPDEPRVHER